MVLVAVGNMCEELEIVDHILVFPRRRFFKLLQFDLEDLEVRCELILVLVLLTLNFVLQIC